MKSMYEAFKNDPELETKGVVHDYGSFRVTLARAGGSNKKFQKLMEQRTKHIKRAIQLDSIDDDVVMDIVQGVFADAVVLNWEVLNSEGHWVEGIEGPDGNLLPVNKENLILTFKNLPDLFADFRRQAQNENLYRAALREAAKGN